MAQSAARLNRLQIREQEQLNRARRMQDEVEEQKQQQRMQMTKQKFNYVPSTASTGFSSTPRSGAGVIGGVSSFAGDDAQIRVFIRECDGDAARSFVYRESEALSGTDVVRELPPPRGGPRRAGSDPTASPLHSPSPSQRPSYSLAQVSNPTPKAGMPNLGRVPRYLQQRKAEMAEAKRAGEEEEARREALSKVPPGHRLVSEEEKAETLKQLSERQLELDMQLRKMPVRFDTQNLRQKRAAIEDELEKIEQTRNKYSTKRPLYVPLYQK